MSPLDRYLNLATRGLWGERRRQVRQELRGAIEDKIWRHTLAGHDPVEAERLALRDLGGAARLAREFGAVHVLPRQLQLGLALSVAALLSITSVPVAAQVAGAPYFQARLTCDYSPAGLSRLERDFGPQTALRERLKTVAPAQLEEQCRAVYRHASDALDYDSLLAVLRKRGVTIHSTPPEQTGLYRVSGDNPPPGSLWLSFPGAPLEVRLDPPIRTPDGRRVLYQQNFIRNLLTGGLPVSLAGDVNPVITVGGASFSLGTKANPILATDLYSGAIDLQLSALVQSPGHLRPIGYYSDPAASTTLPLSDPPALLPSRLAPGTLISGLMRVQTGSGTANTALFTTRVGLQGFFVPRGRTGSQVQLVDTPEALLDAFTPGVLVKVLMVRLMHTDNLSDLSYEVLTADQLRR